MNTQSQKTATFIKKLSGWRGDAALYQLSEPYSGHEHVIVSAVKACISDPFFMLGDGTDVCHETYIFPATPDGGAISMLEMMGSTKDTTDHAEALRNAGYEIAK